MGRGWKGFEVHARNTDVKGRSDEVSVRNEDTLLETGRKVIFVVKCQWTWLNCVPLFCGKENL